MKKTLFLISIIGWSLCIIIVALSFLNINLLKTMPFLLILLPAVFAVFIPSFFLAKNNSHIVEYNENNSDTFFNSNSISLIPFIENCPNWLLAILFVSFIGTASSAAFMFNMESGDPVFINNEFVLKYRGEIIRKITETEFNHLKLLNARYEFGFILVFYAICILVLKRLIEWEKLES
ncbi:hypothetical protein HNP37_003908 [Flavobacterium nitrogenifigens]|uniref:Uncharacterized protein n=2 Tax=Flavobacterium TaxID=237 RepID=A0A7W7J099_9FLAO|nr:MULTISPECIES: hypothetical protein [Flavobacterium]MBB4803828.1 hypothetical protein [Flavobacterium nitrogenifigens]MBB6389020.1 hypothetical protein [Flavobacterium notoginsengisoli]